MSPCVYVFHVEKRCMDFDRICHDYHAIGDYESW